MATLPGTIITGLLDRADDLSDAFRATLRARTYDNVKYNAAPAPDVIPVTTRDGVQLRVHAYGPRNGDVIVLVHGWACCIEYWNPQINAFADRYRVVAFDLRGHGESEKGERPFGPDQLADDLSDVLAAVLRPGRQATMVGHSMGGIAIQAWAKKYPEEVGLRAGAILLACTSGGRIAVESRILPLFNGVLPSPLLLAKAIFGAPVPLPGGRLARAIVKARLAGPHATREQLEFSLGIFRSARPWVRGRYALMLTEMDLMDAASYISVPTSVLAGDNDKLLPQLMSRRIADQLSISGMLDGYRVLPTGHLINVEAEREFNAELHRMVGVAKYGTAAAAG
ncbi:alpha/beta fold hydrolase [Nocardia stercoris]|uniref:Alpha/beta hydrolase n=1 Tax=Nocardia stercoris TaxID=2483361 RepID=A0A3M2KZG4_9NOCA|nr:alpha/beta hydrolase [Nocardia stercoris]RMI30832.1 alpha/beta hydrolase [Nocardia stercoris]